MATRSVLSLIRSNRKELRSRGVGATGLLILEALAWKAPGGFVRLSVAALGRMAGVGRSTALRHVRRLEAIGAVTRLGPAILLNAKSVLGWCADACKKRAAAAKRKFSLKKSESVSTRPTHRAEGYKTQLEQADESWALTRQEALAELKATYIPHWLRKNR